MLKSSLSALALLATSLSVAVAGDDVSVSASVDYTSHYVFRGVTLAESAMQPGFEVSKGSAYGGVWHSSSLSDADVYGNETDYYLGYGFDLSDTTSLDVGVTRYDYESGTGDTTELYAGLAFDVPFAPSVYAYYDLDLEATTLEGSGGYSWPVDEYTSFDVAATLGTVDVDGGGNYEYASLSGALTKTVSDEVGAYASLAYVYSSEDTLIDFDDNTADDGAFVFMVGLSFE